MEYWQRRGANFTKKTKKTHDKFLVYNTRPRHYCSSSKQPAKGTGFDIVNISIYHHTFILQTAAQKYFQI